MKAFLRETGGNFVIVDVRSGDPPVPPLDKDCLIRYEGGYLPCLRPLPAKKYEYLEYTPEDKQRHVESHKKHKVTKTYKRMAEGLFYLIFENPRKQKRFEVRVTGNHPFFVIDRGWIRVDEMEINDACISPKGDSIVLRSSKYVPGEVEVYNFEVEDAHTYYVGDSEDCCLLAHNCNPETLAKPEPEKVAEQLKKLKNNPRWLPHFSSIIAHWSGMLDSVEKKDLAKFNDSIEKMVQHLPALYVDMAYAGKKFPGAVAGEHIIYDSKPNSPEYVGAWGMQPCIAVIIYSPSTGARAAFHFSQTDSAASTLFRYVWPPDCRAIIAGAYDGNQTTKAQLAEVLGFMRTTGMKVDGFISGEYSSAVYVDRKGNWIIVPDPNYVKFVNGTPPTLLPQK